MARASTRRPQGSTAPGAMGRVNPVAFMREVFSELQKSVWPSREETVRLTGVVIALAIFMSLLLGGLDKAFDLIFARFIF